MSHLRLVGGDDDEGNTALKQPSHEWFACTISKYVIDNDSIRKERSGRLALAAAIDDRGARWVVVGDNSTVINSQIVSDPRAALRIIEIAGLWPVLWLDALVVLLCLMGMPLRVHKHQLQLQFVSLGALFIVAALLERLGNQVPTRWLDLYVGESGHDRRNFNVTLADNPDLLNRGHLVRRKEPVSGRLALPNGSLVLFTLIDEVAEIGDVRLSQCHRLGSIETSEGPRLMDAQACRVEGENVRLLIGRQTQAAAFSIEREGGTAIVILDAGFLSQSAPKSNVDWLLTKLK